MGREQDIARVREIDIELDKDGVGELSPRRYQRQKLKRERERIIRRLKGRSPAWFAAGSGHGKVEAVRLKGQVVSIIQHLTQEK